MSSPIANLSYANWMWVAILHNVVCECVVRYACMRTNFYMYTCSYSDRKFLKLDYSMPYKQAHMHKHTHLLDDWFCLHARARHNHWPGTGPNTFIFIWHRMGFLCVCDVTAMSDRWMNYVNGVDDTPHFQRLIFFDKDHKKGSAERVRNTKTVSEWVTCHCICFCFFAHFLVTAAVYWHFAILCPYPFTLEITSPITWKFTCACVSVYVDCIIRLFESRSPHLCR